MRSSDITTWLKTQNELRLFVFKKVKDRSLAEDIVQDVFIKVHAHIQSVKESEKITGWIYQITRNVITDHFRKQSRPILINDLDWENDTSNYNECVASCLKEMLLQMPEKYREAIELTEFENVSQIQLAERLKISYSGAKTRVQRARQMLKSMMNEHYNIKTDVYGNAVVCEDRAPCNC